MTLEELRALRYGGEFKPFRLYTMKGRVFNVLYQELIGIFGTHIFVGDPGIGANEDLPVCDELHELTIDQVDRVEMQDQRLAG